jgi:hypothetical protein
MEEAFLIIVTNVKANVGRIAGLKLVLKSSSQIWLHGSSIQG